MKKGIKRALAALMLTAFLGAGAAAQGGYVLETAGGVMLATERGEALIEAGEYTLLYEVEGLPDGIRRFTAEKLTEKGAFCALLDERGVPLTEFEYQGFEWVNDALIFVRRDRFGAMDASGNILIEADYTALLAAGDGGWLAQKTDPFDEMADTVYRISADGQESMLKTRISGGMFPMREGRSAAASAENGLYGYLDASGNWVIEPRFVWAGMFEGGRAVAATAEGTGLIDRQGNWVLAPRYNSLTREGDSLIVAIEGDSLILIHPDTLEEVSAYRGNQLYAYPSAGGRAIVMHGNRGFVVNERGEEEMSVDGCMNLSRWTGMENQVIVTKGEFGTASVYLYDLQGNVLSEGYQEMMPLGQIDGETYYLCILFEATQVTYGAGMSFWDEIPGTRVCGILSPEGKELFSVRADFIRYAGDGLILMDYEDKTVLADIHGRTIKEYVTEELSHED